MYYRELRMENFADERNSTTTTTTSVPDLSTLKKRTATITPESGAVTVSPTSVPSYAMYCSSASACKFEKDYPRVSLISSLPHPTPPATSMSRKSLTLPSRLQRMLLRGCHRYHDYSANTNLHQHGHSNHHLRCGEEDQAGYRVRW
jgi:hypothetical protein